MPRSLLALVVAGMAISAGCGGFEMAGGGRGTATLTPAPLPPDEATAGTGDPTTPAAGESTPSERSLPPGVSARGGINVRALTRAHAEALADRSYRWVLAFNASDRRGSTVTRELLRREVRVQNATVYVDDVRRIERRSDGETVRTRRVTYADGNVRYVKHVNRSGTTYTAARIAPAATRQDWFVALVRAYIGQFLSVSGATVTGTPADRDGRTLYRVVTTDDPYGVGSPYGIQDVANYTATAYIDSDGLVHELRVEYDVPEDDGAEHVSVAFRYEAVGRTTVEPPAWYGTARNATTPGP